MGHKNRTHGKNKVGKEHLNKVLHLAKTIHNLPYIEKIKYLKKLSNENVDLLSEIVLNFLKGKLRIDFQSYKLLHRVKNEVRILSSKIKKYPFKKKLLVSLKGLKILSVILPMVIQYLINLQ